MGLSRRGGRLALFALAVFMAAGIAALAPAAESASSQEGAPTLEWFGWSNFRLTAPNGKVIFINPFINGNPDAAISVDDIQKADLILAADGHVDEIGSTMDIAQKTGAMVIAPAACSAGSLRRGYRAAEVPQRFACQQIERTSDFGVILAIDPLVCRQGLRQERLRLIALSLVPSSTCANSTSSSAMEFVPSP